MWNSSSFHARCTSKNTEFYTPSSNYFPMGEEEGWSPFFWIKCPWNVTKLGVNLSYIPLLEVGKDLEWRHYLYPKWLLEYNRKNNMTKENLVSVPVSTLCNLADPFSCRRVLHNTVGGFSLHMGVCLGCVERTPHQIQFPAEGVKGYVSATLPMEASEEDAN